MTDYMEYIKGGDILIAPSLDYKHQYILKCCFCEEYYGVFEQFFYHFLTHNELKFNENISCSPMALDSIYSAADEVDNASEEDDNTDVKTPYEVILGDEEGSQMPNHTEEIFIKEEITMQDPYTSMDISQVESPAELHTYRQEDMSYEDVELDKATSESKDRKFSTTMRNFMKSKTNPIVLIEAYKSQPLLWNMNYLPYIRSKERINCLQKIVQALKKELNLKITCNEVSGILIYMRQKYKDKLRREELGKPKTSTDKSLDFLERLDFLKPFMQNNPIAVLSSDMPHLNTEQITQILNIYKKFPHLWDSNLIENWCNNKRRESVEQMSTVINSEMHLQVDPNALENYLSGVHLYLSREKRRDMGVIKTTEPRSENYEDMMFLYEYVSPFVCPECKRQFRNPLYFKEHMIEHDPHARLICSECNKDFRSAELYVEHAKRHMNDLRDECKVCGKQFLRNSILMKHMRIHTDDKSWHCEICGDSFRTKHMFDVHKKDCLHLCPICSEGFYTKDKLKIHMATHRHVRKFVCKICCKGFKSKTMLKRHELSHDGDSHMCQQCGRRYKNKKGLYQHVKAHHNKGNTIAKMNKN